MLKKIRTKAGRKPSPSYGIIDSQSVKTTSASAARGFDGGKKVKGRKRHIVVDVMGNLLAVIVHAANIHDTIAGINPAIVAFDKYPLIQKFGGDCGYRKTFIENVADKLGIDVDISPKIALQDGISPKRWIVERTFAWANNFRRLSKDYEISTSSAENMFMLSHISTLLRRF
ncbi:MAG: transposase [Defluviitaleaceae bacterium]|nr:transposase [Defluviitaleaceae bacterium]